MKQRSEDDPQSPVDGLLERRRIEFDEHGRAALRGLAPGRYRFVVFPADLALDPDEILLDEHTILPVIVRRRAAR